MEKLEYKKLVLEKARERQKELISDLRTRINELRESGVLINEGQLDYDEQAQQDAGMEILDTLADQLNFAVEELNFLDQMQVKAPLHNEVTIGSIVVTNKRVFFPSVSIEAFDVNGGEVFGISAKAPFYHAMKGAKPGDRIDYNGVLYLIEEVY